MNTSYQVFLHLLMPVVEDHQEHAFVKVRFKTPHSEGDGTPWRTMRHLRERRLAGTSCRMWAGVVMIWGRFQEGWALLWIGYIRT